MAPKKLYKYRSFSNLTLDMLVSDRLFFADPTTFNDPLDSNPILDIDLPIENLERMVRTLIERRLKAEMKAAAKKIYFSGPKTLSRIETLARGRVAEEISEIAYNATNPDYEMPDPYRELLGLRVESEVLRQYDKGIVSLAERATCPLMWSHYGDQHRGLCLGYAVQKDDVPSLHKVAYGGNRLVPTSLIERMLSGDDDARRQVDDAVLLRKARDWRYEKEWRLIGTRGLQDAPLELEEVTFGMRCEKSVEFAIIQALEGREKPVRFCQIGTEDATFQLTKYPFHDDEMMAFLPRRSLKQRDLNEMFEEYGGIPKPE